MTDGPRRAIAHIDLGAIERNCARLRALAGGHSELCAVVKANAYGHGQAACARAALAGGADRLAVAAADEAAELREAGLDRPILVMGALTRRDARVALEADAHVVVWTAAGVEELSRLSAAAGRRASVHVKLDSGMGRLGQKDPAAARALARRVADDDHLALAGVMTHFATADERGDDFFPHQLAAFERFVEDARSDVPGVIAHAANSAAAFRDSRSHFDMLRCGIAIYGLDPFGEDPAERGLEPALTLESYVADVKAFEPGESAGYGRRWSASERTRVAVVPIGYGDGVRRGLSDNADVLVGGRRHPLVGTVSMDNVTVELGPDTEAEPGDPVVLIGPQGSERILCEEVARRLGTINYEVTCGIAPRVRREHAGR